MKPNGRTRGDWQANLVDHDDGVRTLLERTERIAVLGIKPETRRAKPAYYVPKYMQDNGYTIIPVPVYYPEAREILGEPVYRSVEAVPGTVDLVDVFRKPGDIPPHVPDLIAARPTAVWFQLGIRNDEAARELAEAGIRVVQDRCLMVEHRRFVA